jgi:phosphomannomutase
MSIRLAFGTAGIRAPLGEGPERINLHTVAGVAHALCAELVASFPRARERGLCVGYDGRSESDLFAGEVTRVARGHGFVVRAFALPVPTPLLAFCTRQHDAVAGVMITASHNPPGDNGIKVYLERGAQVLPPYDAAIARRIASFDASELPRQQSGPTAVLGELETAAYLASVTSLVPAPKDPPRFAYSAMCGVGSATTRALLADQHDWVEVAEQATPRSDFGGLSTPNPEHEVALAAVRALAEREQLELAFAHDPDADRLAVLARERTGALRALSGDEVGALLGDFLLAQAATPTRCALVSTLVSGGMLENIARARGARFERTATGFKWIASRARELERQQGLRFLFGYEEAIGYAFGAIADDKDGVAALYVLLALAGQLRAAGHTLCDRLDQLARVHGRFASRQLTIPGAAAGVMAKLRAIEPAALFGPGAARIDHAPQNELLVFSQPSGSRVCVRPSGTEPKVKFYLHTHAHLSGAELGPADARNLRELARLESALRGVLN